MTAANSQVKEERKARDGRLDKGGWRLMEKRADEQSHSLGYCSINTKQPLPSRDQDFAAFSLARFQDQDFLDGKYGKFSKLDIIQYTYLSPTILSFFYPKCILSVVHLSII